MGWLKWSAFKSSMSNTLYEKLISLFYQGFAIVCFIVSLFAAYYGKNSCATILFLAFFFFLFYSSLDKISKIKAGITGFEAETRKVIKDAESTVGELQSFGKSSILIFISLVKRMGRIGPFTIEEEQKIEHEMRDILLKLDFTDEEINDFIKGSDWFLFACFDYANKILSKVNATSLDANQREVMKELRNFRLKDIPSPEKLASFINKNGLLSSELEEWIKDYEYYVSNGEHRRLDVFTKAGYYSS